MVMQKQGVFWIVICCLWSVLIRQSQAAPTQCFVDASIAYTYLQQTSTSRDVSDNNAKYTHINTAKASKTTVTNAARNEQSEQSKLSVQLTPATGQKININRASEADLVQLKGIGSKRAQDIILYREMMGGFVTVDDLANIRGIGAKTIAKNRHRLSVVD